jgi:alpha-tubulin suppressor-like RCC1 family protein
VRCFGENGDGQLGNGTNNDSADPVQVLGLSNAASLAVGNHHSCAVTRDERIVCWGTNAYGQLGTGNSTDSNQPLAVQGL